MFFVPVQGALLVPTPSNFSLNLLLKPMSKRIRPQTTILKSQGQPKDEMVPKRLPKGSLLGEDRRSHFFIQIAFFRPWTDIGPQEPQGLIFKAFLINFSIYIYMYRYIYIYIYIYYIFILSLPFQRSRAQRPLFRPCVRPSGLVSGGLQN